MEKGDIVVSISTIDDEGFRIITKDKQYKIIGFITKYGIDRLIINADFGDVNYVAKYNFITLEKFRENQLNKILK
jgi:hypothetical protein